MRRLLIVASISLAVSQPTAAVFARDLKNFKSVDVQIPNDNKTFPGGADADTVNNNCLSCHSAEMVLNQPPLPKATWVAEVQKMIKVYKAPIDAGDVTPIADYLAKTKGSK